jgi:hypothetical protein
LLAKDAGGEVKFEGAGNGALLLTLLFVVVVVDVEGGTNFPGGANAVFVDGGVGSEEGPGKTGIFEGALLVFVFVLLLLLLLGAGTGCFGRTKGVGGANFPAGAGGGTNPGGGGNLFIMF